MASGTARLGVGRTFGDASSSAPSRASSRPHTHLHGWAKACRDLDDPVMMAKAWDDPHDRPGENRRQSAVDDRLATPHIWGTSAARLRRFFDGKRIAHGFQLLRSPATMVCVEWVTRLANSSL